MSETEEGGRGPETPRLSLSREQHAGLFERVRALFGLAPASARDDIEDALDESAIEEFTPQERAILKNVLKLHEVRVEDVMVPRADVVALALDTPLRKVLDCFRTAGHSRLPVYEETLDDPRGMIHIRDFLVFLASDPRFGLMSGPAAAPDGGDGETGLDMPLAAARILRPVLYAPPSMPALDLLLKMQASHTHMALVIDEYGGTDGLVSIEDVMESIVGDIEDEHDEDETPELHASEDGGFIAEARAPLDVVSEAVGFDFASLGEAEEVDTIGGLVTAAAGRVPNRGEILKGPGPFEFEVLDADPRRVKRLKIRPLPARPAKPPASPPAANAKPGDQG
jgi:CBS domain containing-hemolysin-like protein